MQNQVADRVEICFLFIDDSEAGAILFCQPWKTGSGVDDKG